MPLDSFGYYDAFKIHCLGWQFKLCIFPRKCHYSKKWLMFRKCYKGTAMWTGPGTPVFEDRWVAKHEFLIRRIKGEI